MLLISHLGFVPRGYHLYVDCEMLYSERGSQVLVFVILNHGNAVLHVLFFVMIRESMTEHTFQIDMSSQYFPKCVETPESSQRRSALIWSPPDAVAGLEAIRLKARDLPAIGSIILVAGRRPMQNLILPFTGTPPLHTSRHTLTHRLALKPRSLQKAKVLRTRRLACKPQPLHIRPQVLMHLERRARRPVRITAVGPGLQTPARIHERCWLRDVVGAEHAPQDG